MNRWKIPAWLELEVIERDSSCVYCGIPFEANASSRGGRRHGNVSQSRIITVDNIARCTACNASKGAKDLAVWLESKYCTSRGITRRSVASVVQAALAVWRDQSSTASNKPLQPTRAAEPNCQREPAGSGPTQLSAGVRRREECKQHAHNAPR